MRHLIRFTPPQEIRLRALLDAHDELERGFCFAYMALNVARKKSPKTLDEERNIFERFTDMIDLFVETIRLRQEIEHCFLSLKIRRDVKWPRFAVPENHMAWGRLFSDCRRDIFRLQFGKRVQPPRRDATEEDFVGAVIEKRLPASLQRADLDAVRKTIRQFVDAG